MKTITVQTTVKAPVQEAWEYWNKPEHITGWAFASDDWRAPRATNDLRVGGKFNTRMESKDGKEGFDFEGTYTNVEEHKKIEYVMSDGRKVSTSFEDSPQGVKITTVFDPENENPEEVQRGGWQAILDNFKKYVENN